MAVIGRPAPPSKLSSSDIADNAIGTAHIQANVITHADLAPNSVTSSEMADDAVGIAELSASGTPNATSFLRGDNSWQVVDTEGTGIKSTGESGGTKFLREDGDGTSSWQTAGSPSITDNGNATALTIGADEGLTINGSLQQLTNRNLSGTYSSHELFIADGFTLTGNITVNEDIVLTKLSDDGNTLTLTTDGNSQTITGSGSIEASTLAQTPVTSLTGMTGELGSVVTGSPALNLSNTTGKIDKAQTPSGSVVQTFSAPANAVSGFDWSSSQPGTSAVTITLSGITSGNKVLVMMQGTLFHDTGTSGSNHAQIFLQGSSNSGFPATTSGLRIRSEFGRIHSPTTDWIIYHGGVTALSDPCTSASPTYSLYYYPSANGAFTVWFEDWRIICQEIQQ